jgi:putative oxidoreductase
MAGSAKSEAMIALVARIVLAAVFCYAGGVKALDPAGFALSIDHYQLLPWPAAAALAVYLPWLELGCGFGVLWSKTHGGALAILLGLGLVFSEATASALIRSLDISCGCFGDGGHGRFSLAISLIRSVSLTLLCGWLLWREKKKHGANGPGQNP